MDWKLLTVVLISLILLVVSYLTIVSPLQDVKNYFISKKQDETRSPPINLKIIRKIKIDLLTEKDFIDFILNNKSIQDAFIDKKAEYIAYYFPEECPNYKLGYFLIDINDEGHENYHVPENGHLIVVKKEHLWTKEPIFKYWRLEL